MQDLERSPLETSTSSAGSALLHALSRLRLKVGIEHAKRVAAVLAISAGGFAMTAADGTGSLSDPVGAHPRTGALAPVAFGGSWDRALSAVFVENRGQMDPRIRFLLRGPSASVAFTVGGATYELGGTMGSSSGRRVAGWILEQGFVGGRSNVQPVGEGPTGGTMSYFTGDQNAWVTGVPTFSRIGYRDVWPGIDVVYSLSRGHLEYSFSVAPGADPARIAMAYRGATSVRVGSDRAVQVRTPAGSFEDHAPLAFQLVGGVRRPVPAAFAPRSLPASTTNLTYGFRIGAFDRSAPLVIDPVSIGYAGYLGGSGEDQGLAVAVGPGGDAYVVGQTLSTEATFPVKVGPDLTQNGQTDAFVCKVSPAGQVVYCGFIGGSEPDRARGVAVDAAGSAYVYGWTRSKQGDGFPVTVGPDLTYNGGTTDTFICKVDPTGSTLRYCGYIGGDRHDEGKAIAVDGSGTAYVTGGTKSPDLPVNAGFGRPYAGNGDVFVAKVKRSGTGLDWLGYIGGAESEHARGIAVDAAGAVSVAGTTGSSQATFPVKVGPDLTYNGGGDAFVGRVSADGSTLDYLGYVGGIGFDDARDAAGSADGTIFFCGHTTSTQATFPVKVGPDLTYNGGHDDAFVAVVRSTGVLSAAGYVGGSAADACYGIGVDPAGRVFVSGHTFSSQSSFPEKLGPDLTYNGGGDAFVAEIAAGETGLVYCGYVGGSDRDVSWGVAVDGNDAAILTGQTWSAEDSFPVKMGPDLTYNGGGDAFVVKVTS